MSHDWTAVHQREQLDRAAREGDLQRVKELLAGKYPVNRFDELGKTPLHYAVGGEHLPIVDLLLRSGAKVNAHDERTIGDMLNDPVEVPVLAADAAKLVDLIKPSGNAPLTFTTSGLGRPRDVTLIPYYRVAHERYTLYWKVAAV